VAAAAALASSVTMPVGWEFTGIEEVLDLRGRAGHERDHGDVPMRGDSRLVAI
jgi:hypothetical protein